jgi:uncharacterized protein YqeY
MSLKSQLDKDFIDAYKSKKETQVSVLRMLKSAIKNFEINNKAEATDAEVIKILKKETKQRQEAITEFKKADRQDLIDKETAELEIIEKYLPAEMGETELLALIKETINENDLDLNKDAGRLIGLVIKKSQGQADGTRVSGLVAKLKNGNEK